MSEKKKAITKEELAACVDVLRKLKPGRQDLTIFTEVIRLFPLPAFEVVPLRMTNGVVDVLLTRRPPDDLWYGNQMHSPGVMVVSTDKDEDGGFKKTTERWRKEVEGVEIIGEPTFVKNLLLETKRGVEQAMVHWIEFGEGTGRATICDVSDLPTDLIEHHRKIIPVAVEAFREFKARA